MKATSAMLAVEALSNKKVKFGSAIPVTGKCFLAKINLIKEIIVRQDLLIRVACFLVSMQEDTKVINVINVLFDDFWRD